MPNLFVDFDGTIADTITAITALYNDDFCAYPNFSTVNPDNIETWNFRELECADYNYINTYFNQPRFFFEKLEFMDGARSAIRELGKIFDNVIVVSMGENPNLRLKKLWLKEHLPDCKFIGCDWSQYTDKAHVNMRGDFFIDDSSHNLITSNASVKICFGKKYPWNDDWHGTRCVKWSDVLDYIYIGVENC